jgi:arabinose-5-phosphate isomerase
LPTQPAKNIIEIGRRTFTQESAALIRLSELIDESFEKAVLEIKACTGRVVITGIGKSALIGNKIVATLNSTGTPAVFMHAAEAIHGDLGTVQKLDVVLCISNSGSTEEIRMLIPLIKRGGNVLIGMTGREDSPLGQQSDIRLNTHVEEEACPLNLTPTTSTTAQLVMGDALAIALLELRGFGPEDFAHYHPGGALGKKLYLRVGDISSKNKKPQVEADTPIKKVIVEISENMLGVAAVMDQDQIIGIITDGDVRRMLESHDNIAALRAADIMTAHPQSIDHNTLAVKALELIREKNISQVLVTKNGKYHGVVHIHNLINEGIV